MTRGRGAKGALHGSEAARVTSPCCFRKCSKALAPKDGETYIDGTFGAGGYTRAILGRSELQSSGTRSRPECGPRCGGADR